MSVVYFDGSDKTVYSVYHKVESTHEKCKGCLEWVSCCSIENVCVCKEGAKLKFLRGLDGNWWRTYLRKLSTAQEAEKSSFYVLTERRNLFVVPGIRLV